MLPFRTTWGTGSKAHRPGWNVPRDNSDVDGSDTSRIQNFEPLVRSVRAVVFGCVTVLGFGLRIDPDHLVRQVRPGPAGPAGRALPAHGPGEPVAVGAGILRPVHRAVGQGYQFHRVELGRAGVRDTDGPA